MRKYYRTLNHEAVGTGLPWNGILIRYGSPTLAVTSLIEGSNKTFGAAGFKKTTQ